MNVGRWCLVGLTCYIFATLLMGSGCRPANGSIHEPDQIKVISPDPQYGVSGTSGVKRVCLEVLTAPIPGLLGGSGSRQPAVGERLLLRAIDPGTGLKPLVSEGQTDPGGRFEFEVELGPAFGDQYLEVACSSRPSVKKRLRFVSGVVAANDNQEAVAGQTLPNPFRITLLNAQSEPIVGVPVYFSLVGQPGKGAQLTPSMSVTDSDGIAEVELKTVPSMTGVYTVSAEISDSSGNLHARPIQLEANAMHIPGLVIGVLGGLAIFIFGMTLMSEGLQQAAGNRMKRILAMITGNRFKAIAAGAIIAGLVHSSSATTVMTVGFVNAGLLTLKQAVGVVLGANIGTTVTGQMVSFNLTNLALPSIVLGMLLLFVLKRPAGQGLARSLLGFGLLFFGMEMMSSQLKNVSEFPSFIQLFRMIDCQPAAPGAPISFKMVLGAAGIGVLTTMLVQSSTATIGLAIALANSGLLNIWTAIPIVLGDNIGTTITALLAALNANRTARQTALAHALFNTFGMAVVLLLINLPIKGVPSFYYAVDLITKGDVFHGENVGRHIAAAHTLFNLMAVLLFIPFFGVLIWLCSKLIREPAAAPRTLLVTLDQGWLATPSLALDGAVRATAEMTEKAVRVISVTLNCYRSSRKVPLEELKRLESETDEMQRLIMDYLMRLTNRQLSLSQTHAIPILIHCVSDAERIADIGISIAELVPSEGARQLTEGARQELGELIGHVRSMAKCVLEGLSGQPTVDRAIRHEGKLRILFQQAEQGHIARLQNGGCNIERGIVYVEVLALLESIVRHLGNIATRTPAITTGLAQP